MLYFPNFVIRPTTRAFHRHQDRVIRSQDEEVIKEGVKKAKADVKGKSVSKSR